MPLRGDLSADAARRSNTTWRPRGVLIDHSGKQRDGIICCLLLILLADREIFRAAPGPERDWADSTSWNQQTLIPDRHDRVLIPGRAGQTRSIRVARGTNARTASLIVGGFSGATGSLAVDGNLRVSGQTSEAELRAGRLDVGRARGSGVIIQSPGSIVRISKSLGIGSVANSEGRYIISDARLAARRRIDVGHEEARDATLELHGTATVEAPVLSMESDRARLVMTASSAGVPRITVKRSADLSGILKVNLQTLAGGAREIILVQNEGSVAGGFRNVVVDAPAGETWELTYSGGDGNDIALRRNTSGTQKFEQWQSARFGRKSTTTTAAPFADPDNDNLSNIGEYKLGCCPLTDEGPPVVVRIDSQGRTYVRYTVRTDRSDVRVIPQVSVDGRIWTSEKIETRTVSRVGNSSVKRATSLIPNSKIRLAFELQPEAGARRNVLFVVIDDLNDWVEVLGGHPQALTPNLNKLAARGLCFTQAHAAATLCNPSRAALLTGLSPASSGIYTGKGKLRDSPVLKHVSTLPECFHRAGYRTLGAGKIFHRTPLLRTWDDYFPSLTRSRPHDPVPDNPPLNQIFDRPGHFDWGPLPADTSPMGDTLVADWMSAQIAEGPAESPSLWMVGLYRPHLPFYAPVADFTPWKQDQIQLPERLATDADDLPPAAIERIYRGGDENNNDHRSVLAASEWQAAVHAYLACMHFADRQLGRVIASLDASPACRNTIIVVTSDHGWHLGEKRAWRKETLWEEATRVPLIVVAPGTTTPGTSCRVPVSLLDLYPTLNELCALGHTGKLDGISLVPQLANSNAIRGTPVVTTQEYLCHTVRSQRWRYTRYRNGDEELYDHDADPHEWKNLAGDPSFESVIRSLRKQLPASNHPDIGGG